VSLSLLKDYYILNLPIKIHENVYVNGVKNEKVKIDNHFVVTINTRARDELADSKSLEIFDSMEELSILNSAMRKAFLKEVLEDGVYPPTSKERAALKFLPQSSFWGKWVDEMIESFQRSIAIGLFYPRLIISGQGFKERYTGPRKDILPAIYRR
jgi:hypothetical protein